MQASTTVHAPPVAVAAARPPIVARRPTLPLANVPRHWLANSAAATHMANGINLLFPVGERAFVRSVNHFMPRLQDPALRARIRGFFGQEGRHAHAHDEFNQVLRDQGFEIDSFLARYEQVLNWLEAHVSPTTRLAMTAAAEHFTAIMAADTLSRAAPLLDVAHPTMAALLGWHAAEEIEHKSVAFDVLMAIDPSYARRVQGLLLSTLSMAGYWLWGTLHLWKQEGLSARQGLAQLNALRQRAAAAGTTPVRGVGRRVFARGIRAYLRRDFHPDQADDYHLARTFMAAYAAQLGLASASA